MNDENVVTKYFGFKNKHVLFQYKRNRDILLEAFSELGFQTAKPDGAFYLFMMSPESDAVAFCEKDGVAYQYPRTTSGEGNESGTIHKSTDGVRTLFVGLPTRNLHSGAEIIKYRDLEAVNTFVKAWLLDCE